MPLKLSMIMLSHFRQILKHQKKMSLEKFLVRKRSSESEPGVNGVKKSREGMAGEESPAVILEEDHRTPEEQSPIVIIAGDPPIQTMTIITAGKKKLHFHCVSFYGSVVSLDSKIYVKLLF